MTFTHVVHYSQIPDEWEFVFDLDCPLGYKLHLIFFNAKVFTKKL